ncbi:feline leukemia virus subgroup C receptor-related protein 2 [Caerostris extrusa]|uniref:Feline leukemia virus subgroup C receptor-related protein 2 n=1 Tax=Caerostris extrusa TaxID=172846 RepID=A0AAV4N3Y5_CAEEX|nr:feline leukemia virus subgroup C receptor-related protein 2 [Caerostris extrusa]
MRKQKDLEILNKEAEIQAAIEKAKEVPPVPTTMQVVATADTQTNRAATKRKSPAHDDDDGSFTQRAELLLLFNIIHPLEILIRPDRRTYHQTSWKVLLSTKTKKTFNPHKIPKIALHKKMTYECIREDYGCSVCSASCPCCLECCFRSFPVSPLINYLDLRRTVICASFWTVLATLTQFATLKPNSFIYVMISCFFASLSDLFVLAVPPVLAAKWFPSQELSTACAFGVFGNQLGIALGFVLPTQIVSSECSQTDLISTGKGNLATILSSVNIVVFLLIVFTFQNAPKFPPSISEAHKKKEDDQSHFQVVLSMIKNRNFILVFIMYGMMVGCFIAMSTNLNNLVLHFSQ